MTNDAKQWFFLAAIGAMTSTVRVAAAQPTNAAQALFDDGRRLFKEGAFAAACAKFAESQRIEPAAGTLMNLAACHVREGKTATAWAEFNDVLAESARDGRADRVDEAKVQIARLEPHLPRLVVVVNRVEPGLTVLLDGTSLGPASWSTAIPVDPGDHEVRATAPGFDAWSMHAPVAETGARITVPGLTPLSASEPARPLSSGTVTAPPEDAPPRREVPRDTPPPDESTHAPVAAWVLGGIGVVGVGVGTYFGIVAAQKKNDSGPDCTSAGCTSAGASLLRDANSAAWVSDVGFGVGVASLASAAYFFLARPSATPAPSALGIAPTVGLGWVRLGAGGRW